MYSSLFKTSDVRVTQQFYSGHKALDLSRGVVRQPIYSGVKLGAGVVSYTATKYSSYENTWVVYIKYENGMTCRMFHGQVNDAVVKTGDKVAPGQQVYRTGSTGNSDGDHLHYVLLDKNGVAIDPSPWVLNDHVEDFKKNDTVRFTGIQYIRSGSGIQYPVARNSIVGETGTIIDGPRYSDGYVWYDMKFNAGGTGWVANVGKFEVFVSTDIPEPPQQTQWEKDIERLKEKIKGLEEALAASELKNNISLDRIKVCEANLKLREEEIKEVEVELDRVTEERNRFEKEKNELLATGTLASATTRDIFAELWKRVTRSIQ